MSDKEREVEPGCLMVILLVIAIFAIGGNIRDIRDDYRAVHRAELDAAKAAATVLESEAK